jgi:DNA-binding HxlR family transcriptional regulator
MPAIDTPAGPAIDTTSVAPTGNRPGACSVITAIDALGDTWSILVLRELFFGVHRFNDIQRELEISRSVLTNRLSRLVAIGVVRSVPYQDPGDRVRHEYRLTRKGVGLLPVVVALMQWGDAHVREDEPPIVLRHRDTGAPVRLELRAGDGPVEPHEIVPHRA